MLLLLDIGNTHTHLGLANSKRVLRQANIETRLWFQNGARSAIEQFIGEHKIEFAAYCSVVPKATARCAQFLKRARFKSVGLNHKNIAGVGIDYPRPQTIGTDRLANAIAARHFHGAPVIVVDFGTAVTFDVVNASGNYVGGIIAPGLSAMTDYLHEKTALLPKIEIREPRGVIGKNTEQAMLVGAVHGYRGLIRGLLQQLQVELKSKQLPVIATGGCAGLIAKKMPEITAVQPNLTLEGLRLLALEHLRPAQN
jgi:type III pantothenate kinase